MYFMEHANILKRRFRWFVFGALFTGAVVLGVVCIEPRKYEANARLLMRMEVINDSCRVDEMLPTRPNGLTISAREAVIRGPAVMGPAAKIFQAQMILDGRGSSETVQTEARANAILKEARHPLCDDKAALLAAIDELSSQTKVARENEQSQFVTVIGSAFEKPRAVALANSVAFAAR
jgi:hypothetical protein